MMEAISPLLLAFITGLVAGFFVSLPVGPINLTILHEGVQRGFRWAMLIGFGAVTMETVYCLIGFAGFTGLFDSKVMRAVMELISFILMLYLGIKFLRTSKLEDVSRHAAEIEQRLHPHTAYMTGFVRVLCNPNVLLFWLTLSATFISHEWVAATWSAKFACIGGVAAGATLWFLLLSFAVSRGHDRFSDHTLLRVSQVSGALLLGVAVVIGARLVMLLATH